MHVPNSELGSFLVDTRLIARAELAHAQAQAQERGVTLLAYLEDTHLIPEDELTRAVAHVLGVPFAALGFDEVSPEALVLAPEPLARTHSFAVFKQEGDVAHVALTSLEALEHLRFLEDENHLRLVPRMTDRASIKRALMLHQKHLRDVYAHKLKSAEPADVLDALVSHALLSRAHEVYLDALPGAELRVRYRVHGALYEAMKLSAQAAAILSALKEYAGLSFTLQAPQEGRFKFTLKNGEHVRVGVHVLFAQQGESVHLTLVHEASGQKGFTLKALGFHGEAVHAMHELLAKRSGLVLVASPKEQGKSTALYTLLDLAVAPHEVALSVEEEIELTLPGVIQTQVKRELGSTLVSSIRAALKHNPSVLMLSTINDEDSATLAAVAAGRGMLVLAGIEATSATDAIGRILSFGVEPLLLASVLQGALASRVVRKLCPACKEAQPLSRADIEVLESQANLGHALAALKTEGVVEPTLQWRDATHYKAVGCAACSEGYAGNTGLYEVLTTTAVTKELIKTGTSQQGSLCVDTQLSLAEDGVFKAIAGQTTLKEVERALKA